MAVAKIPPAATEAKLESLASICGKVSFRLALEERRDFGTYA
jgi:hypothetical protein